MTPSEVAKARDVSPNASLRHVRALSIIARSDCLACHRTDTRFVGPGFREIARRYAGQNVLDKVAQKIVSGGKGVWGEAMMPPHPSITSAEASTLAQYVLSLSDANARPRRLPLAGSYTTTDQKTPIRDNLAQPVTSRGSYVLRATLYRQRGERCCPTHDEHGGAAASSTPPAGDRGQHLVRHHVQSLQGRPGVRDSAQRIVSRVQSDRPRWNRQHRGRCADAILHVVAFQGRHRRSAPRLGERDPWQVRPSRSFRRRSRALLFSGPNSTSRCR